MKVKAEILKFLTISVCISGACNFFANSQAHAKYLNQQPKAQNIESFTLGKSDNLSKNINETSAKIQVAILLDSSNSMDGLIDQARTQIWSVINALSKVTKNGETPAIEVSLYHYGNDTLPSSEGFNRMLNELTTDLDLISENLFSIKTDGGQEYAGWVIDSAIKELKWSNSAEDFRVIFIAGNEPFTQGSVNWQEAISSAKVNDVIVNTIYCGTSESSESNLWATAASQGKGNYFNLNQNQVNTVIKTPYDAEILKLNQELNQTYIPYGLEGQRNLLRQQAQDSNAFSRNSSGAGFSRAISKASGNYQNASWDLVDAVVNDRVDLAQIDKSSLPENLRSKTILQIRAEIEAMSQERATIKSKITQLGEKRTEYITKETPKQNVDQTLDNLMISALYKQLEAKNFVINK